MIAVPTEEAAAAHAAPAAPSAATATVSVVEQQQPTPSWMQEVELVTVTAAALTNQMV
eukprot:COSAG05_NODE_2295_length_3264_cov_2.986730_4_plen_58_part_00